VSSSQTRSVARGRARLARRCAGAVLLALAGRAGAQEPASPRPAPPDSAADSASAVPRPADARPRAIGPVHRDAWKPALALVGLTAAMIPLDQPIFDRLRHPYRPKSDAFHHTMVAFDQVGGAGGVQIIGPALWGLGIVGRWRGPADMGMHLTEAFAAATATHYVTRALIGRPRPSDLRRVPTDEFHLRWDWKRNIDGQPKAEEGSFASGHSLTTFAAATVMHYEIGAWAPRIATPVRIAAWTIAIGDGVSRVYRDNHWATDIVGAAAIGVFVGRTVVGLQHGHPNNLVDRVLRRVTFSPGGAMLRF
jgi:membrane-associated phospholipid phosphatase